MTTFLRKSIALALAVSLPSAGLDGCKAKKKSSAVKSEQPETRRAYALWTLNIKLQDTAPSEDVLECWYYYENTLAWFGDQNAASNWTLFRDVATSQPAGIKHVNGRPFARKQISAELAIVGAEANAVYERVVQSRAADAAFDVQSLYKNEILLTSLESLDAKNASQVAFRCPLPQMVANALEQTRRAQPDTFLTRIIVDSGFLESGEFAKGAQGVGQGGQSGQASFALANVPAAAAGAAAKGIFGLFDDFARMLAGKTGNVLDDATRTGASALDDLVAKNGDNVFTSLNREGAQSSIVKFNRRGSTGNVKPTADVPPTSTKPGTSGSTKPPVSNRGTTSPNPNVKALPPADEVGVSQVNLARSLEAPQPGAGASAASSAASSAIDPGLARSTNLRAALKSKARATEGQVPLEQIQKVLAEVEGLPRMQTHFTDDPALADVYSRLLKRTSPHPDHANPASLNPKKLNPLYDEFIDRLNANIIRRAKAKAPTPGTAGQGRSVIPAAEGNAGGVGNSGGSSVPGPSSGNPTSALPVNASEPQRLLMAATDEVDGAIAKTKDAVDRAPEVPDGVEKASKTRGLRRQFRFRDKDTAINNANQRPPVDGTRVGVLGRAKNLARSTWNWTRNVSSFALWTVVPGAIAWNTLGQPGVPPPTQPASVTFGSTDDVPWANAEGAIEDALNPPMPSSEQIKTALQEVSTALGVDLTTVLDNGTAEQRKQLACGLASKIGMCFPVSICIASLLAKQDNTICMDRCNDPELNSKSPEPTCQ